MDEGRYDKLIERLNRIEVRLIHLDMKFDKLTTHLMPKPKAI